MLVNKLEKKSFHIDKNKYPVVIIGAGLGGLCCGAFLSRLGFPVTILEKNSHPGGCASCFKRKTHKFEVSLTGTGIVGTPAINMLDELNILPELVEPNELLRIKTPVHDVVFPQKDAGELIKILSSLYPSEKNGIRRFITDITSIAKKVLSFIQKNKNKAPSPFLLNPVQKLMWKMRGLTLEDYVDQYVKDRHLKNMLTIHWGTQGLPPSRLSAFRYALITGNMLTNGLYYHQGGSQKLSDGLDQTVKKNGGDIRYKTYAEKLNIKDGIIKGVTLSNGEYVKAKVVVNNTSPYAMIHGINSEDLSVIKTKSQIDNYKPTISAFIIWIGMKNKIKDIVSEYSIRLASGREPGLDYQAFLDGDIKNGPLGISIFGNLPGLKDSSISSTIHIIMPCGYAPWKRFETEYFKGRKEKYYKVKQIWEDTIIQRVEDRLIPGFKSMVDVVESATPLTIMRYTKNTGGAVFGFEQQVNSLSYLDNRTPIKGLYLTGAWSKPGPGVANVIWSGGITAEKIITDLMVHR